MMPWQDYRRLSDEEVASVVAYLRTLPPVKKAREHDRDPRAGALVHEVRARSR